MGQGRQVIGACVDCSIPFLTGLLPEAKKPRLLHGTLIMKDSVSV